ncbi:YflT domain-containing protein [Lederbergia lenta]|uniref:Stress response protein n=1 Tax=Lederbergia lenta TaxID=1467 RepID=A0A2X4VUT1_LEDLE|nr:general stress protein [Lederbergia lenta]MCM3111290.1 general stress protein [Lederbergia lenta]MEC2325321.1 general stress protein [Lederbergia lenta]SQI55816.1 stress response protein [Lederbergia lenta]
MKNVVGVFNSSFEAVKAIDSMRQDGIDRSHIHVIVNDDFGSNLIEEKTGVDVEQALQHSKEEQKGFWQELKSFFSSDTHEHTQHSDYLHDMGLTASDVDTYATDLENGKILVLVDSDLDIGRNRNVTTDDPLEDNELNNHSLNTLSANDETIRNAEMPDSLESALLQKSENKTQREKEYEEEEDLFYKRDLLGQVGAERSNKSDENTDSRS